MGLSDRDYHREDPLPMGGGAPPIFRFSPVVRTLFFLNIAVFVVNNMLLARPDNPGGLFMAGYFSVEKAFGGFQIWRLVSYQFLHAGLWHLVMNSIVLYFFGPLIESLLGPRRFLAFYLLCGIAGAAAMTLLCLVPGLLEGVGAASPLIGASGAIFGVLAAGAVAFPNLIVHLVIPPIPLKLRTLAIVVLSIAVVHVLFNLNNAGGEAAHLGGAVMGFFLIYNLRLLDILDGGARKVRFVPVAGKKPAKPKSVEKRDRPGSPSRDDVDRVLDKIAAQGIHSLTADEKRILEAARDELSRNDR